MAGTGLSTDFRSALVATVVAIKANGGRLYNLFVTNPNTVSEWIQFFDLAPADVILGTTTPKFSLGIPKGASPTDVGAMEAEWGEGVEFFTSMSYAATTTPTGLTAPTTGLTTNAFFR